MGKYIAVLDIGKTNKKVLIFSDELKMIDSEYKSIEADETGDIHFEKTTETKEWFFDTLADFAKKYDIGSISISTHGATFVCIDKKGKLSMPVVAYTTPTDDNFQDKFFEKYGTPEELQRKYLTCNLGGLTNLGKGIEFVKETYPNEFANTAMILNYPQYFGFELTGNYGAEPTFLGCHSYLWDNDKKGFSDIIKEIGAKDKVPAKIENSNAILGTIKPELHKKLGLSEDVIVTMGVHDSNSSLVPYIIQASEDFILNSTGTWCVAMCPNDDTNYTQNDIETGSFHNINIFGEPVKTSTFMGGGERVFYADLFKKLYGLKGYPDFNQEIYDDIIGKCETFILPGYMEGTGPFPKSTSRIIHKGKVIDPKTLENPDDGPECFKDPEYAYAVLVLSLAIQSSIQLQNIGLKDNMSVYIEGGFRFNTGYHAALANLCHNSKIVLSDLEEATAFGAALLAKSAKDKTDLKDLKTLFEIKTENIPNYSIKGIDKYKKTFLEFV